MTTDSVYKSRWGYHPCDYELFAKLKRLHKGYWQALYDFHRWHRWQRKDARNRIGTEPAFNGLFIEDATWWKPVRSHGIDGFKVYPLTVVDQGVVALYQSARRPQPEPVAPFDDKTRRLIESLYARLVT